MILIRKSSILRPQTQTGQWTRRVCVPLILACLTSANIQAQEKTKESPAPAAKDKPAAKTASTAASPAPTPAPSAAPQSAAQSGDPNKPPAKPGQKPGAKATTKGKKVGKDVVVTSQNVTLSANTIDVDRQPLRIVFSGASMRDLSEQKVPAEQARQWKKACETIGTALKVGFGPWGMGAFSEFTCPKGRTIAPDAKTKLDWVLEVKPIEGKQMSFKLMRIRPSADGEKAGKPTTYNEIKVPVHPKFLEVLADTELADFIAHALLNSMPIALFLPSYSLVEHASVDYARKIYRGRSWESSSKFIQPAPFSKMSLFRVYFNTDKNLYEANPAGEMKFDGFESQKMNDGKGSVALAPVWNINDEGLSQLKVAGHLWGRRAKASKRGQQRLNRLVVRVYRYLTEGDPTHVKGLLAHPSGEANDEQGLLDRVKNLDVELPGGYSGFRYGKCLVTKDKLLAKTGFLGILVSVKAGYLDGFSLFADISPKVIYNDEFGNTSYVSWQRIVLGYSIDFQIYDFRFDLTPKIGQWNFHAALIPQGIDPKLGTFGLDLSNSISAGYELGVELRVPLVSARAWIGQDGAISLANKYTGSSVRSFRGGIDAFYTLGELFSVGTRELGMAILGFTFFDYITLANKQSAVDENGDPVELSEVGYVSSFLGGGLSISW